MERLHRAALVAGPALGAQLGVDDRLVVRLQVLGRPRELLGRAQHPAAAAAAEADEERVLRVRGLEDHPVALGLVEEGERLLAGQGLAVARGDRGPRGAADREADPARAIVCRQGSPSRSLPWRQTQFRAAQGPSPSSTSLRASS